MPQDNQNQQSLEDLTRLLIKLNNVHAVNTLSKKKTLIEADKQGSLDTILKQTASIMTRGAHPNLLLNMTDGAYQNEINHYKRIQKEELSPEIETHRLKIVSNYASFLNEEIKKSLPNLTEQVTKKYEKSPELSKLNAEGKKKLIDEEVEANIYAYLGKEFINLRLKEGYNKDKDLKENYDILNRLRDLDKSEIDKASREIAMKNYRLSSNIMNIPYDFSADYENELQIVSQALAQTLVKKKKEAGGQITYTVDHEKLEEAFGEYESYLAMSGNAYKNLQKD